MDIPALYRRAGLRGIHTRRAQVTAWRDHPQTNDAYRAYCERVLDAMDALIAEFAPIQLPLFAQEKAA